MVPIHFIPLGAGIAFSVESVHSGETSRDPLPTSPFISLAVYSAETKSQSSGTSTEKTPFQGVLLSATFPARQAQIDYLSRVCRTRHFDFNDQTGRPYQTYAQGNRPEHQTISISYLVRGVWYGLSHEKFVLSVVDWCVYCVNDFRGLAISGVV